MKKRKSKRESKSRGNPPLFAETQELFGGKPPDNSEASEGPSPVYDGCVYFRISDRELTLAEEWYRRELKPPELLRFAILQADLWLQKDTAGAIKARKAASHKPYLYDTWTLVKAAEAMEQAKSGRTIGSNGHRKMSNQEKNEQFLKDARERLKQQEEHDQARTFEFTHRD